MTLDSNSPSLSQSEVREVLQYVPVFSGKCFVIVFGELSDQLMAELLLDLISLQRIGVRLILVYPGEDDTSLLDWAAEVELKLSKSGEVDAILGRGQAALVQGALVLDEDLATLARKNQVDKILYLGDPKQYPSDWSGALSLSSLQGEERSAFQDNIISMISGGVSRIHLLDSEMPGCLSRELFSNEGVGIMIYGDSYLEIRSLTEEDLPELLAISGRSMRTQHLLPRTYEEVEAQIGDYYVMAIDGNVVGSVAIHGYGDLCELAYLFVKKSHEGLGYGQDLVKFAEVRAREVGYKQIFALSTEAGGFFEIRHHYQQVALSQIPDSRREKLEASGRNSIALIKSLYV